MANNQEDQNQLALDIQNLQQQLSLASNQLAAGKVQLEFSKENNYPLETPENYVNDMQSLVDRLTAMLNGVKLEAGN